MKYRQMALMTIWLLLMAGLLFWGGCSRHYIEVYIDEEGRLATADLDHIKPLLVFPGDYVVFINTRVPPEPGVPRWVELDFPEGFFDVESVKIDPGKRAIVKVIADGPLSGNIQVSGPGIPMGDPEVKVGEGP